MSIVLTDGTKSIPLNALPREAWHIISGRDRHDGDPYRYYDLVSVVYRSIKMRANAISGLPFVVFGKNEDDIVYDSTSDDMMSDRLAFSTGLSDIFGLTEASLCMTSTAYWYRQKTGLGVLKGLQYLSPTSITPQWSEIDGLTHYTRQLAGKENSLSLDDIVHIYSSSITRDHDGYLSPSGCHDECGGRF